MRNYFSETIGTFALVFCGTGAIIINDLSGGAVTHVGIALTFGMIVLAMIYALGDISGAHLNPAVTIAFAIAKKMNGKEIMPYLIAQVSGALLASISLKLLFPDHQQLGTTLPAGSAWQSFILELILTFFLMFVILKVSSGTNEKGIIAGLVVGAVVALEALFAGPISGASMNPARSLAPAIVSGNLQHLWIYLLAPVSGALLAVYSFQFIRSKESVNN